MKNKFTDEAIGPFPRDTHSSVVASVHPRSRHAWLTVTWFVTCSGFPQFVHAAPEEVTAQPAEPPSSSVSSPAPEITPAHPSPEEAVDMQIRLSRSLFDQGLTAYSAGAYTEAARWWG